MEELSYFPLEVSAWDEGDRSGLVLLHTPHPEPSGWHRIDHQLIEPIITESEVVLVEEVDSEQEILVHTQESLRTPYSLTRLPTREDLLLLGDVIREVEEFH